MKYYVTIYIDELFEQELWDTNFKDFTHTFLGLTRKHPDEIDKQDEVLKQEKLKNADWKDFDKKWYESLGTNKFNDGFYGFGTASKDLGIMGKAIGKVFENNHLRR